MYPANVIRYVYFFKIMDGAGNYHIYTILNRLYSTFLNSVSLDLHGKFSLFAGLIDKK